MNIHSYVLVLVINWCIRLEISKVDFSGSALLFTLNISHQKRTHVRNVVISLCLAHGRSSETKWNIFTQINIKPLIYLLPTECFHVIRVSLAQEKLCDSSKKFINKKRGAKNYVTHIKSSAKVMLDWNIKFAGMSYITEVFYKGDLFINLVYYAFIVLIKSRSPR